MSWRKHRSLGELDGVICRVCKMQLNKDGTCDYCKKKLKKEKSFNEMTPEEQVDYMDEEDERHQRGD